MQNQRAPTIRWLKPREAAAAFRISDSSIRKIIKAMEQDRAGKYGIIHYGGIVRIRKDKITQFLLGGSKWQK